VTTEAKILANRRNAQKSTGPRTPKGKAVVSQNAMKYGLSTPQAVISTEDQAEFDSYRDQFLEELSPETPMESMLAERIVNLSWRLKRATRIQNQTIDALKRRQISDPLTELKKSFPFKAPLLPHDHLSQSPPDLALGRLAIKDFSNSRVLERLLMYERRLESSLYKTIVELQRLNLIKGLGNDYKLPAARFSSQKRANP
jgi:hypothetical protein